VTDFAAPETRDPPPLPFAPERVPGEIEQGAVNRLSPRIVIVWRAIGGILALVAAVPALVAGLALDLPWLGLLVLAVGGALAWTVPPRRWRHWSWRVGEADVRVAHGAWWRRESVVLHSRIQHVDTHQGPIERTLGLASVVLYTAGTVGAAVKIPGLPEAEAESLRDRLVALSGVDDAV
jgi:membrane protein YdbS with pleckstrin-like domain